MRSLQALYKFTYPKPKPMPQANPRDLKDQAKEFQPKELPKKLDFIRQHDVEPKIFFYQLEADQYISLEVLLKAYASQLIRVTIGQWLTLIDLIYQKLLKSYYNNESIGKITQENIWISTETGFCGTITYQENMDVIFLTYQDTRISIQDNLVEFSVIQNQIWKICRNTEFKLRVRDGKNTLAIQQIMNVIDQILFYDIQQTLYKDPAKLPDKIKEFVNDQQETQYECCQDDLKYIEKNYEQLYQFLNKISNPEGSTSEFQQHKKLLEWQRALFNQFKGFEWNQQSYEYVQETLQFVEKYILNNSELDDYKRKYMERDIFYLMEQNQFFNFNSPKIRLSGMIAIKKQIKALLDKEIKNPVKEQHEKVKKLYQDKIFDSGLKNQVARQVINLDQLLNYYSENCGRFYGLNKKFYFTINFQLDWENTLVKFIANETITLEQEQLKEQLQKQFQLLVQKYII